MIGPFLLVLLASSPPWKVTRYSLPPERTGSEDLASRVLKHVSSVDTFLSSCPQTRHNVAAYEEVLEFLQRRPAPGDGSGPGDRRVLLDSGCGTGRSTVRLALRHPDATVIGVDRSAVRLGRGKNAMGDLPENALCVRAELGGFWRLIAERGDFAVDEHFLYYPNPYPKKRDLGKRWHGHPTFPVLLGLGARRLVLRSNWRPYLEEFEEASRLAGAGFPPYEATLEQPSIERAADAMTNFEEKYVREGEPVWELVLARR